jgi:crotonobetainyl-CoA:carnitine CoA-transferase CaiB-like acyl-CoA transferase
MMQQAPLAGIRVLEFGGYISAPYSASILCSLGAEVIKVERPHVGDDFRRGLDDGSLYFKQYNAGKRSLAVDLKTTEGVELVKALVPSADVVLENLRPGKMDSLGLGRDALTALRPDLVYVSVTGFGNGGPMAQRPAYDMIGQSFGGFIHTLSDAGDAKLTGTCLADLVTGLSTATGILAALVGRSSTGGMHVETSIAEAVSTLTIDAMTQFFEDGAAPTRQSRHPQALNFCLRAASGEFITLHLSSSQKFWESLVEAMNRPEMLTDERFQTFNDRMGHYHDLAKILEGEFMLLPGAEWEKRLIERDVPFAPVLSVETYRDHPQVQWLDVQEPVRDGVGLVRVPWRFAGERPRRSSGAPKVGEHSRTVAGEVYDEDRVGALIASGVLDAGRDQ